MDNPAHEKSAHPSPFHRNKLATLWSKPTRNVESLYRTYCTEKSNELAKHGPQLRMHPSL